MRYCTWYRKCIPDERLVFGQKLLEIKKSLMEHTDLHFTEGDSCAKYKTKIFHISDASPKNLDEMDSMPHIKFYTKFTSLGERTESFLKGTQSTNWFWIWTICRFSLHGFSSSYWWCTDCFMVSSTNGESITLKKGVLGVSSCFLTVLLIRSLKINVVTGWKKLVYQRRTA